MRVSRLKALLAGISLLALPAGPLLAADEMVWGELNPENTVFMQLQTGTVVIELNPRFAPKTVEQFKRLTQERFYDGLGFYRVIDGFVAQGGDGSNREGRGEGVGDGALARPTPSGNANHEASPLDVHGAPL